MDITGTDLTCEVCGTLVGMGEDFRILTGALCSEDEQKHQRTGVVRPVRNIKKYVYLIVCGNPECGQTAVGRIWRGVVV